MVKIIFSLQHALKSIIKNYWKQPQGSLHYFYKISIFFLRLDQSIHSFISLQIKHRLYKLDEKMGQDTSEVIDELRKDEIINCSICRQGYNLGNRQPLMVCTNQHTICEECLPTLLKTKKCFQCKENLLPKRHKHQILAYIIQKLNIDDTRQPINLKKKQENRGETISIARPQIDNTKSRTIQSPERRVIKIKTVKHQSTTNLNLQIFQQQRQFRKKYSVASIFSPLKEVPSEPVPHQDKPEDAIAKIAEEYQIIPLKDIVKKNENPSSVRNLDLHLYRIPKIFEVLSQFRSLQRLNLSKYVLSSAKNRILKIQNLSKLANLQYLSLSQNQIQIIQNLQSLVQLKNLYLNRNRLDKIEGLSSLTRLEFLGLAFNSIVRIQNITHLLDLKWLSLEGNYIAKIQGLLPLIKLEILLLGSNQIQVFQGIQTLTSLQQIHLQNNKITDLRKALAMKHLRRIRLQQNPGLGEDNSQQYLRLLELIQAKSKGIEKNSEEGCNIY